MGEKRLTPEHFDTKDLEFNSRNMVNWINLLSKILDLEDWQYKKLRRYVNRTDVARRRKELEDIFGDGDLLW